jgi:hypothetical protein
MGLYWVINLPVFNLPRSHCATPSRFPTASTVLRPAIGAALTLDLPFPSASQPLGRCDDVTSSETGQNEPTDDSIPG